MSMDTGYLPGRISLVGFVDACECLGAECHCVEYFFEVFAEFGGDMIVPSIVALLTITFPPGKVRNIAFGLFGATSPIGVAGRSILAGLFVQLTPWKYVIIFM